MGIVPIKRFIFNLQNLFWKMQNLALLTIGNHQRDFTYILMLYGFLESKHEKLKDKVSYKIYNVWQYNLLNSSPI